MQKSDGAKKLNISFSRNINNTINKIKEAFAKKRKNVIITLVVIFIAIIIFSAIIINNVSIYSTYIKYEEKMNIYGFDTMYNNKSSKTDEPVTKAEALKLAISATFNTSDISNFATFHDDYPDATWVEYAKAAKITTEDINNTNFNVSARYIDVIQYFENCKTIFLKDKSLKDTEINITDILEYNATEQVAIKDMIANGIIVESTERINGKENIFKGKLNELVVNYAQKYNTITMPGDKINISSEKVPSNAKDYPYTLASIDKTVYEKPFFTEHELDKMSPSELFKYKKEDYSQVQRFVEGYFNTILNVDYNTITEESFKRSIEGYLIYKPNEYAIKSYVDNVKTNKTVIKGNAKVQFPAIYSDGISYRVRVRINLDIVSTNTKNNLIYLDYINGLDKTYQKSKYDLLVDYYMTNAINSSTIFMKEVDLYNAIIEKEKSGIIQEIDDEDYSKEGTDAKE